MKYNLFLTSETDKIIFWRNLNKKLSPEEAVMEDVKHENQINFNSGSKFYFPLLSGTTLCAYKYIV